MFELKRLNAESIAAALEKARHYRLLNEPTEAVSICLDVLEVEPENQQALVLLLLAETDRFNHGHSDALPRAKDALAKLATPYDHAYFGGIVLERWAKSRLKQGGIGASEVVYDLLRQAMERFEEASALAPTGNDEALLRYNTCVRILQSRPDLGPAPAHARPAMLE
ncbi:MAG: hypothetical protein AB7G12_13770 [Thermoanaerobaculia bacterium]